MEEVQKILNLRFACVLMPATRIEELSINRGQGVSGRLDFPEICSQDSLWVIVKGRN
jgi:hypothetical protein